jgi:hypothetical protein
MGVMPTAGAYAPPPPPPIAAPLPPPPPVTPHAIAAPSTMDRLPGAQPSPGFPNPAPLAPPQMLSPGALSGPMGAPAPIQRVLVGFVVTFQNEPSGSFWPIYSGRTTVGRAGGDAGLDISISDASASSRHASIHADPTTGYAFAEDESSRNGTFVNEQKLAPGERRQMRDNDRLRLGSTTFVVKLLVS